jgi:hypothetical protein
MFQTGNEIQTKFRDNEIHRKFRGNSGTSMIGNSGTWKFREIQGHP